MGFFWRLGPGSISLRFDDDPTVRGAMEAARPNEPQTLDLQMHVCEIPAPPFKGEAHERANWRVCSASRQ